MILLSNDYLEIREYLYNDLTQLDSKPPWNLQCTHSPTWKGDRGQASDRDSKEFT